MFACLGIARTPENGNGHDEGDDDFSNIFFIPQLRFYIFYNTERQTFVSIIQFKKL